MPDPSLPWPEAFAAAVGRRVAEYRRSRGFTAQQLADELKAQLGLDMKRTVIGSLESGARKAVNVTEILGIAYVLRVSPLLLLYPVGTEETIEALPGRVVDTWGAAKWFSGEGIFPTHWPDDDRKAWQELRESALALQLYRQHEQLLARRRGKAAELKNELAASERSPHTERHSRMVRFLENDLHDDDRWIGTFRDQMRRSGVTPPPLPVDLAHLDTDRGGERPHKTIFEWSAEALSEGEEQHE